MISKVTTIGVFAIFATILTFGITSVSANAAIPDNAYETNSSYGKKWKCLRGFREKRDLCEKVMVPKNAYLRSGGDGWECNRGYLQKNNTCVSVDLPPNAYLTGRAYGSGWQCDRGYLADSKGCNKITVPANAYLSETNTGRGWKCDRGFEAKSNACQLIKIPANAHVGYSGNSWECTEPYRRVGEMCKAQN